MAIDPHLGEEKQDEYYADGDTGEILGDVEDLDADEDNPYYIKVVDTEFQCPNCGYTGSRYHPRRDRPTFNAKMRKLCPNTSCRGELERVSTE